MRPDLVKLFAARKLVIILEIEPVRDREIYAEGIRNNPEFTSLFTYVVSLVAVHNCMFGTDCGVIAVYKT